MREIDLVSLDPQVLREVSGDDVTYTALALSRSGKVIFTGTSSGTVRVIRNPLPLQKDWTEYQAHCGPVTKVHPGSPTGSNVDA